MISLIIKMKIQHNKALFLMYRDYDNVHIILMLKPIH